MSYSHTEREFYRTINELKQEISSLKQELRRLSANTGTTTVKRITTTQTSAGEHDSLAGVSEDQHHAKDHASRHGNGGGDELSHDALADFVAAEHIDWTQDQGATNIDSGNVTEAAVTQHQGALSITESQVSDLDHTTPINSAISTHAADVDAHHAKYTNAEAVDAVEAVAAGVAVLADSIPFIDLTDGVLKQETLSDLNALLDHDNLANFTADEHFTQAAISITESQVSDLDHTTPINSAISTHAADVDAHHAKYLDSEAVDAIEAVGLATPVSTDWLIFSDAGVLKKVALSSLDEDMLTALKSYIDSTAGSAYTDAEAVDAIEAVGLATPVAADWMIFSDAGVLKKVALSSLDENMLTAIKAYVDASAAYSDADAVDAVEAVATATPVSTDTVVFSDAGVLKRVAFEDIDESMLTAIRDYAGYKYDHFEYFAVAHYNVYIIERLDTGTKLDFYNGGAVQTDQSVTGGNSVGADMANTSTSELLIASRDTLNYPFSLSSVYNDISPSEIYVGFWFYVDDHTLVDNNPHEFYFGLISSASNAEYNFTPTKSGWQFITFRLDDISSGATPTGTDDLDDFGFRTSGDGTSTSYKVRWDKLFLYQSFHYRKTEVDDAIDADITTHTGSASAHHSRYTDAEAVAAVHSKYTNAEAVDAIEAVGDAVAVAADKVIFSDAGTLKQEAFSDLDETVLTAIKSYIDNLFYGKGLVYPIYTIPNGTNCSLSNITSTNTQAYKGSGVLFNTSANGDFVQYMFYIPTWVTANEFTIKCIYYSYGSESMATLLYAAAHADGEDMDSGGNNLMNGTAKSLITPAASYELVEDTLLSASTTINPGDTVTIRIVCNDASMSRWVTIRSIWIEWDLSAE